VHGAAAASEQLLSALEARKQQIGQLELAAAAAAYYSLGDSLAGREVIHFVDNSAAVAGLAKSYSSKPDSARIIHAFQAVAVSLKCHVHFQWVASEANVADLPSRGHFDFLEQELGSSDVGFKLPSVSEWLSVDEAATEAGVQSGPPHKKRGGRRGGAASSH
jgi:hypothetical protein